MSCKIGAIDSIGVYAPDKNTIGIITAIVYKVNCAVLAAKVDKTIPNEVILNWNITKPTKNKNKDPSILTQ